MATDGISSEMLQTNGAAQDQSTNGVANETALPPQGISADEIALYDRQIRLWGVQAQERIRSANVLLVSVKALGTEIAKNLILNGIGSLTIVDEGTITEDDLGAQYFLREEDIGLNRALSASTRLQELNPRVIVTPNSNDIRIADQSYYALFDLIIACDLDFATITQINTACRLVQRPFYAAGVHGFYGFIFADLVEHEYIIEREQPNVPTTLKAESATRTIIGVTSKKENGKNIEMVTKKEIYSHLLMANSSPLPQDYLTNRRKLRSVTPLLPCLRALWDFERSAGRFPSHSHADLQIFTTMATQKLKELQIPQEALRADFLRSFIQNIGSELVPTAALVGGRLAEDAINVIGKREQPLQNMALFDGENFQGPIYALHPIFTDQVPEMASTPEAATTILDGPSNAADNSVAAIDSSQPASNPDQPVASNGSTDATDSKAPIS